MALCIYNYEIDNLIFFFYFIFVFSLTKKSILHLWFLMHFFPPEDEKEVRISLTVTFFCFKKLCFKLEFANSAQFHDQRCEVFSVNYPAAYLECFILCLAQLWSILFK